jgi:hypothetical protein
MQSQSRDSEPTISSRNRTISATTARAPFGDIAKPMWLVSTSTALSRAISTPRADGAPTMPSSRDHSASVGTGGFSSLVRDRRIVDRVARDPFVQPPHVGVAASVARHRRAESHHRPHALRLRPRQLARIDSAQAPADQKHRLVMAAQIDRPLELLEYVGARSHVPAVPPRVDPEIRPRRAPGATPWCAGHGRGNPGSPSPAARPSAPAAPGGRWCAGHAEGALEPPSAAGACLARRPCSEELASHQLLKRFGKPHPTVLGLVVFEQRHEDSRGLASAVLLSVCANRTLPSESR